MNRKTFARACLSIFLLIVLVGSVFAEGLPTVTSVEVKGLRRIEEGSVKAKLSQKTGDVLSQEKTTEDIKTIYKMGYFDDVNVSLEPFEGGIKVIYMVKEKPTVIKVDFQGNKEYDDAKLKEHESITPGAIADITLINDNALKLRTFYEDEGYYLAKVVPVINKTDEGEVVVTYQITEGDKVKIKKIIIENNKAISASKIKKAMKTKERGLISFITGTGYYKKEEMKASIEQIRDLYYDNGYLKVVVGDPVVKLMDDNKGMTITIPVSEGDQFKMSSVAIAGNKVFSDADLMKLIKMKQGMVFSKAVMREDVTALTDKHSNNGYALVSINPDIVPDEEKKLVGLTYRIAEGDKYRIGKIDISGNTKTRDKVIRREIRVDEGDYFNSSALKRSYERLNNLNFFETVDIAPKPKAAEKIVDLDVKVKEKSTGSLNIGGGYSSVDKVIGMVELSQANLFGNGQLLKVKGELGTRMNDAELTFRDPWFFDKEIGFGATIYKNKRDYPDFTRNAVGLEISVGKRFWEYWSAGIAYNLEQVKVSNVVDTASLIVQQQLGKKITSAISPSIARDTRDNLMDPLRGSLNSLSATFAGLGGDNDFIKAVVDSGWYFPLFDVTTIHLRGRIGWISGIFGKTVPLYENFYVGGIYTVRGLGWGIAGPKDPSTGEAIGGTKEAVFNAEYIFPIVRELKIKGVVFSDAGRAWGIGETFGSDLRYTAGTGVRWTSPFGPIRVEYGYNLSRKTGESSGKVEFSFGSSF
ncbi:MAG TPA: outer membrane protein assembly factor BamA [Dissulfurispiraceae bacterium]|nr:outer membrane protein assembly factor BamA [Dissulfurispiraceae bacterium]